MTLEWCYLVTLELVFCKCVVVLGVGVDFVMQPRHTPRPAPSPRPCCRSSKVSLMASYCRQRSVTEVPDPYYGGTKGFELVLDLLEDASVGLLDKVCHERSLPSPQAP